MSKISLLPTFEDEALHTLDEVVSLRLDSFNKSLDAISTFFFPDKCNKKILPFLAYQFGVDFKLDSLTETQQRDLIYTSIGLHKKIGTPYAVKKALQSLGATAEVLEWFKTESEPYTFKIQIFLTDDLTQVLKRDDFNKYEKLIERTKNVRSRFESFIVDIPTITAEVKVSSGSEALKVRPFMNINELIINNDISLNSGWSYKATAKTAINENIATSDTNIKGGYRWQVEV